MSLVLVGLWLGALGLCDLGRASHDTLTVRRGAACWGAGAIVLLVGLLLLRPAPGWGVALWVVLGALLALWLAASSAALDGGGRERRRARARSLALAALGCGALVATLGAQAFDGVLAWPGFLDRTLPARWPAAHVVVAVGVTLAQLVTANVAVRLLLDAVGVPATTNEKQLKGGRVLGPMERVFLVSLGAAGELAAAAVVVAAKGLLRFPELQRAQRAQGTRERDGPTDVTEYFLIGSFASWLLALAGVALIRLS